MHTNSIHLNLKCLFSDINRTGSLFSPPVATSFHTKAANVIKFYVLNQTLLDVCKSFRLWQWIEWEVGLNFMQYFDVISQTLRVPFIQLWISVHQQTSGTWKNGNIKVWNAFAVCISLWNWITFKGFSLSSAYSPAWTDSLGVSLINIFSKGKKMLIFPSAHLFCHQIFMNIFRMGFKVCSGVEDMFLNN